MTKSRAVDLEPIDRLEGKIKLLVAALDHLRSDQARIVEENQRLRKDVEALRGQLAGV
jgi:regulator of replication initiation timing